MVGGTSHARLDCAETISSVLAGNEVSRDSVWSGSQEDFIETEVDAGWALCLRTRRSTFGEKGLWFLGCSICSCSKVQQKVACCPAEGEYRSLFSGAAESLFVRALMTELGSGIKRIHRSTDASAVRAKSQRTLVPARVKLMSVRFLYVHQLVRQRHSQQSF